MRLKSFKVVKSCTALISAGILMLSIVVGPYASVFSFPLASASPTLLVQTNSCASGNFWCEAEHVCKATGASCGGTGSTTGGTATGSNCPSGQTQCPAVGNAPAGCYTTCPTATGTTGSNGSTACPSGQIQCPAVGTSPAGCYTTCPTATGTTGSNGSMPWCSALNRNATTTECAAATSSTSTTTWCQALNRQATATECAAATSSTSTTTWCQALNRQATATECAAAGTNTQTQCQTGQVYCPSVQSANGPTTAGCYTGACPTVGGTTTQTCQSGQVSCGTYGCKTAADCESLTPVCQPGQYPGQIGANGKAIMCKQAATNQQMTCPSGQQVCDGANGGKYCATTCQTQTLTQCPAGQNYCPPTAVNNQGYCSTSPCATIGTQQPMTCPQGQQVCKGPNGGDYCATSCQSTWTQPSQPQGGNACETAYMACMSTAGNDAAKTKVCADTAAQCAQTQSGTTNMQPNFGTNFGKQPFTNGTRMPGPFPGGPFPGGPFPGGPFPGGPFPGGPFPGGPFGPTGHQDFKNFQSTNGGNGSAGDYCESEAGSTDPYCMMNQGREFERFEFEFNAEDFGPYEGQVDFGQLQQAQNDAYQAYGQAQAVREEIGYVEAATDGAPCIEMDNARLYAEALDELGAVLENATEDNFAAVDAARKELFGSQPMRPGRPFGPPPEWKPEHGRMQQMPNVMQKLHETCEGGFFALQELSRLEGELASLELDPDGLNPKLAKIYDELLVAIEEVKADPSLIVPKPPQPGRRGRPEEPPMAQLWRMFEQLAREGNKMREFQNSCGQLEMMYGDISAWLSGEGEGPELTDQTAKAAEKALGIIEQSLGAAEEGDKNACRKGLQALALIERKVFGEEGEEGEFFDRGELMKRNLFGEDYEEKQFDYYKDLYESNDQDFDEDEIARLIQEQLAEKLGDLNKTIDDLRNALTQQITQVAILQEQVMTALTVIPELAEMVNNISSMTQTLTASLGKTAEQELKVAHDILAANTLYLPEDENVKRAEQTDKVAEVILPIIQVLPPDYVEDLEKEDIDILEIVQTALVQPLSNNTADEVVQDASALYKYLQTAVQVDEEGVPAEFIEEKEKVAQEKVEEFFTVFAEKVDAPEEVKARIEEGKQEFPDVNPGDWYYSTAEASGVLEIFYGNPVVDEDGDVVEDAARTFDAAESLTVAATMQLMANQFEIAPSPENFPAGVKAPDWVKPSVGGLIAEGILTPADLKRPEFDLTKTEISRPFIAEVVMKTIADQEGIDLEKDFGSCKLEFEDVTCKDPEGLYVHAANEMGIMKGQGEGEIFGEAGANRAEMATILLRADKDLEIIKDLGSVELYLEAINE